MTIFTTLIEERLKKTGIKIKKKQVDYALGEIQKALKNLKNYQPKQLNYSYNSYYCGIHTESMEATENMEEAIYDMLYYRLRFEDEQTSFSILTKNGAKQVAQIELSGLSDL